MIQQNYLTYALFSSYNRRKLTSLSQNLALFHQKISLMIFTHINCGYCLQYQQIMESRKQASGQQDRSLPSEIKLNTQRNNSQTFINDNSQLPPPQEENKQKQSSYLEILSNIFALYQYCDAGEKRLIALGIFFGLLSGGLYPPFVYFWGQQLNHQFQQFDNLKSSLDLSAKYFGAKLGFGFAILLAHGFLFTTWRVISESVSRKFRQRFLQSFAKRRVDWIQQQNLYEFSSSFKSHVQNIQNAIGEKVALILNLIGLTMACGIASLCVRWTLALFYIAILPLGGIVLIIFLGVIIKKKQSSAEFYRAANSQSVEATSLIKTVKLLGCEEHQINIYKNHLNQFSQKIKSFPLKIGFSTGLFYFIQYFIFALGFIYGIQCVRGTSACPTSATGSHYTVAQLHIIFITMTYCAYSYLQLAINIEAIQNAVKSSKVIYQFIQETDSLNEAKFERNLEIQELDRRIKSIGQIQLKNIIFAYPSAPSKNILKGLSIKFLKNKFNAIVGVTGVGKSTIIQLLLKYYQSQKGSITFDGTDINQIDPEWLRSKIGFVGQQPVLFNGTVRDNLRIGKPDATDEQIYQALKKSSIYDFVMQIPQKLDYNIGLGGSKLSGGQKQRLAIARALIKKPELLILDEATSALDRKTERVIQKTINNLFKQKQNSITVICIAHRIKTIRKADKIWYIQNGIVKESGKFEQLQCYKDIEIQEDGQQIDLGQVFYYDPQQKSMQLSHRPNEAVDEYKGSIYGRILAQCKIHRCLYFIAIILALLNGLNHPAASILKSYIYYTQIQLYRAGNKFNWTGSIEGQLDSWHDQTIKYIIGYIGLALYVIIPNFVQFTIMTKVQDQITNNIRVDVFKKLMIMPTAWYERPQNQGGRAAQRYGAEAQRMSGLVSNYIPVLIANFTTMTAGIALALYYQWKIGLLNILVLPAITLGGYLSITFISGFEDEHLHRYQPSNRIADEMILSIKTLYALNYHKRMLQRYKESLFQPTKDMAWRGFKIGIMYGFAYFVVKISVAIATFSSAHIIANDPQLDQKGFIFGFISSALCGWYAGNSFFFAANTGAGKQSAKSIFKFLDSNDEKTDQQRPHKNLALPNKIKGRIQFRNVSFKYKQGLNSKNVVDNISFVIQAGQKAAFVGESGSGKTTLFQLLQRFYKHEGEILLDGVNILDYDINQYRSYFSVLSQQPNLFVGTIHDNLLLNTGKSQEEIIEACELTYSYDVTRSWKGDISVKDNIKEFIKREVGPKGSGVSGGQKQRLACARSILRQPQIFLMDEGTSALDRQTEKRVQQNLDKKFKGITSINIAHRIESIQNSDIIFLLEDGKIIESGRYHEMMERKSHFSQFVKGSKFKTMNQVAELILQKLVAKILGFKK